MARSLEFLYFWRSTGATTSGVKLSESIHFVDILPKVGPVSGPSPPIPQKLVLLLLFYWSSHTAGDGDS